MTITDRRIGKKVPAFIRREDAAGVRIDSGPYIGKIKNNYDPARVGRLQVWIPDLGAGDEEDPSNWRTVSYASPFFGSTAQAPEEKNNKFKTVRHTYGFWFTPPDLDNFVLCTFIAGDPMRGFWFGCISTQLGQHMVPAVGGSKKYDEGNIEDPKLKAAKRNKDDPIPVVEFNENQYQEWSKFTEIKKPVHEEQYKILINQGLDRDTVRGVITSSSQRESPSGVFGISTPGEAIIDDNKSKQIDKKVKSGEVTPQDVIVYARKGGHSLVMDDGDAKGKNKLVRLRSAGGHQIIMNDTEEIFYIGNNTGNVWVELSGSGNISVFSEANISFRTKGNVNFHADKDFTIHSDGEFSVFAKKAIKLESETITSVTTKKTTIYGNGVELGSQGRIDINPTGAGSFSAGGELVLSGSVVKINSGRGPKVQKPQPIKVHKHAEAEKDRNGQWESKPQKIKSIAKIVPTHEPWPRGPGKSSPSGSSASSAAGSSSGQSPAPEAAVTAASLPSPGVQTAPQSFAAPQNFEVSVASLSATGVSGPVSAANKSLSNPVDRSFMYRNDNFLPSIEIAGLDDIQLKALKTQIAWYESKFNYRSEQTNKLGKYHISSEMLASLGYIKIDAYNKYQARSVDYPSSWTGKGGAYSKEDFLSNGSLQEETFEESLKLNYRLMKKNGSVKVDDSLPMLAGMLAVAHFLGAAEARNWRAQSGSPESIEYYNMGRYAVEVLANLD